MAVVYKHTRMDNGLPFYIGIGKTIARAYSKYGRNIWWKKITSVTHYNVEIIKKDISWDEACQIEKELIKLYGRKDIKTGILCNLTDGGDGNVNWTPSLRIAQSNRMKGKPGYNKGVPQSLEHRKKTSKTRIEKGLAKGDKNPMYGKRAELSPHYGKKRPEHSKMMKNIKKPEGFGEKCKLNKQGEKNPSCKLKEDDVKYIRMVYKKGDKQFGGTPLSIKFGVSLSLISNIVKYKKWKHL
jgi:hypothetical protein